LRDFATGHAQDVGGQLRKCDGKYAYIDGTCEIALPPGPVTVVVSKGPEFKPIRQEFVLVPGRMALRLELERWINLRQQGWYAGDTQVHYMTPQAALLEGAAEDLTVVNLLAREDVLTNPPEDEEGASRPVGNRRRISNILAFSGQRPVLEMPGHLVVVNTFNYHQQLGQLALLNCHRPVYPLTFGGPESWDSWTLADWCDQCHRKGGLVVATPPELGKHLAHEVLADLILGKVDALQVSDWYWDQELGTMWAQLLACGFHIPLVGGSRKVSNLDQIGGTRTYARLQPGDEFTYKNWIEAVRAGRTFVTTGPLISLSVNGHDPGAVLDLPDGDTTVQVKAEAQSLDAFDYLAVLMNGSVAARSEASGSPSRATLEADLVVREGSLLVATCMGPFIFERMLQIAAFTSPVYVRPGGRESRPDPAAVESLTADLDRGAKWVDLEGRFENDRQREHLAGIFQAARNVLRKRLHAS
jgi:hypothetical protein